MDDEDYERINQWKWCARRQKNGNFYAVRNTRSLGKSQTILMHRVILNAPTSKHVDHINTGETLNNQKTNIRVCSRSENLFNRPKQKNNTSGYKDVSWHARVRKWHATIRMNGHNKSLGLYTNKKDAAKAYDDAAIKYRGEFAETNFK